MADKIVTALDRLGRATRAHRQAVATGTGLTPLQVELLRVLADGEPPEPRIGLLAAELDVRQPTVTDALQALGRKGLISQHAAPHDGRQRHVRLTGSGTAVAAELAAADDILSECVAGLPEREQATALRVLLDLIGSLVDGGVLTVARICPTCTYYRDEGRVPYCALLQADLDPPSLRVNCPDHEPRDRAAG